MATDIATALAHPGCERLREWASIGPVQTAALEEFVAALLWPKPVSTAFMGVNPRTGALEFSAHQPSPSVMRDFNMQPLYSAPAAPAPEPLMTGYLVRNKAQVAEAVAAFGPTKDLGYLWSYMHGADDIDATEACAHLEVVRLYSAPAAPAPAWQPIETAPKNCVDVLLNIPGRQPVVAAFYRGGWAPVDLGGNHLRGTPTHWMPLPEAPAIAASKESK